MSGISKKSKKCEEEIDSSRDDEDDQIEELRKSSIVSLSSEHYGHIVFPEGDRT